MEIPKWSQMNCEYVRVWTFARQHGWDVSCHCRLRIRINPASWKRKRQLVVVESCEIPEAHLSMHRTERHRYRARAVRRGGGPPDRRAERPGRASEGCCDIGFLLRANFEEGSRQMSLYSNIHDILYLDYIHDTSSWLKWSKWWLWFPNSLTSHLHNISNIWFDYKNLWLNCIFQNSNRINADETKHISSMYFSRHHS